MAAAHVALYGSRGHVELGNCKTIDGITHCEVRHKEKPIRYTGWDEPDQVMAAILVFGLLIIILFASISSQRRETK